MSYTNDFDGIQDNATFALASGIARGTDESKVIKLSAAKAVALCSAEDKFFGQLRTIDNDNAYGVVKETGYAKLAYSGTAPTVGQAVELVANGAGGVKIPATSGTGNYYKVVEVNTTDLTVTIRLG